MVLCCKRASYVNSKIYVLINAISNIFFFFISPHSTETVTVYNSVLRIRNRFFFQPHGSSPHFFFKLSHLDLAKNEINAIYISYIFSAKKCDIYWKALIFIIKVGFGSEPRITCVIFLKVGSRSATLVGMDLRADEGETDEHDQRQGQVVHLQ